MKIFVKRFAFSGICLLIFSGLAYGQAQGTRTWQTIVSPNGEFSVSIPEPFVVYQDKLLRSTKIVGGADGVGVDLSFSHYSIDDKEEKNAMAKRFQKGSYSVLKVGKSLIHLHKYETANIFRHWAVISTPRASYSLLLYARGTDKAAAQSLLASVRLNGQSVMNDLTSAEPVARGSINAKELKDSDLVRLALKTKQNGSTVAEPDNIGYVWVDDETVFSRPGMVLNQPYARYTPDARDNNVQGTVRLRIQLKGDGNVGNILVLEGLPFGLTEEALRAARAIKFLPAEVGGRPADFDVTREYTFRIY